MGLYDTVCFTCPRCNGGLEVQSKMGECDLANFPSRQVPVAIAKDIEGDLAHCEACEVSWRVIMIPKIDFVAMALVKA